MKFKKRTAKGDKYTIFTTDSKYLEHFPIIGEIELEKKGTQLCFWSKGGLDYMNNGNDLIPIIPPKYPLGHKEIKELVLSYLSDDSEYTSTDINLLLLKLRDIGLSEEDYKNVYQLIHTYILKLDNTLKQVRKELLIVHNNIDLKNER